MNYFLFFIIIGITIYKNNNKSNKVSFSDVRIPRTRSDYILRHDHRMIYYLTHHTKNLSCKIRSQRHDDDDVVRCLGKFTAVNRLVCSPGGALASC